MNTTDPFLNAVTNSRALTNEQKADLLADPQLPEGYRQKITKILQTFDKNSKAREAYLREKLDILHTEFVRMVETSDLDENRKKELLEKAKNLNDSFFPT